MLTARAITSTPIASETADWTSMASLAHLAGGITSVGRTALAQLTSGGSPDHRPAHDTVPGHNQLQRVAASPAVIRRDDRPVAQPRVRGGGAAGSTVFSMVSSSRFGGGWDLGPAGRSHASAGPLSSRAWAGPACGMR